MANTHQGLAKRLDALAMSHDTFSRNTRNQLRQIFEALRELAAPADPPPPKRPIGFITPEDKKNSKSSSAKAKSKKA